MQNTEFLKLNMPELSDKADIRKISEDMKWIDDVIKKLNDLHASIEQRLTRLELKGENTDTVISGIRSDVSSLIRGVDGLVVRINSLEASVTDTAKRINTLSDRQAADVAQLTKQTAALESRLAVLADNLKKTDSSVAEITKQIAEVNGRVASYDSTISELKIALSNVNATIKSITDVTENLDARVTALEKGPEPEPVPPVQKFYVYWGASAAETPNMSVVSGLPYKTYTDTVLRTITVPCNSEYCYYCIPKSEGSVQFEVSGFTGGFESPVEVGVIDSEGNSVIYNVYRSTQLLEGTAPIKVKR